MAIIDALFDFWDDLTVTTTNGTTTPTASAVKTLNFINSDLEMGSGTPMYFNARVGTTEITGTTIKMQLVAHPTIDAAGTGLVVLDSGAITIGASLAPGTWLARMAIPVDVDAEKFLVVKMVATGTVTGKINAWLDYGPQSSYDTQVSTSNI